MYVLRRPDERLLAFIEHYWFVLGEGDEPVDLRVEVFVDARADLIFNFGVPYRREVIGGGTAELSASNLDAQRLVPIRIAQRGRVRVEGVRFRLGGVAPFTEAALAPFSGETPPPHAVFGREVERLEAALHGEDDPDAATALLDAFFLDRLERIGPDPRLHTALATLEDGSASVTEAAERAGVSPRHLERLFARQLGFPPKTVTRVLRFQRALTALMADPGVTLDAVAASSGYFDQAHFIRDFRRFSGGLPRGYRGYFPPAAPTDFAPNVVVFVQDDEGRAVADSAHIEGTRGHDRADHRERDGRGPVAAADAAGDLRVPDAP